MRVLPVTASDVLNAAEIGQTSKLPSNGNLTVLAPQADATRVASMFYVNRDSFNGKSWATASVFSGVFADSLTPSVCR